MKCLFVLCNDIMGTKVNLVLPSTHMKGINENVCCPLHLSDGEK